MSTIILLEDLNKNIPWLLTESESKSLLDILERISILPPHIVIPNNFPHITLPNTYSHLPTIMRDPNVSILNLKLTKIILPTQ